MAQAPSLSGFYTLDLARRWPVIVLGAGAALTLKHIVVFNPQSWSAPEVKASNLTMTYGLATWPSIDPKAGSEVRTGAGARLLHRRWRAGTGAR